MPRLPEKPDSDFDAQTRTAFDRMAAYGAFDSWSRLAAHHPPVLDQAGAMLTALRDGTTLPVRLSELAMVTVSKINACDYCATNHGPKLQVTGLSAEGIDRLTDVENHPELTALWSAMPKPSPPAPDGCGMPRSARSRPSDRRPDRRADMAYCPDGGFQPIQRRAADHARVMQAAPQPLHTPVRAHR